MRLPEEMEIPLISLSARDSLAALANQVPVQMRQTRGRRSLSTYLGTNPAWCQGMKGRIRAETSGAGLAALWRDEIGPHVKQGAWTVLGTANHAADYTVGLRRDLTTLVGPEDASLLIANLSDEAELLPSLGPVVGLAESGAG